MRYMAVCTCGYKVCSFPWPVEARARHAYNLSKKGDLTAVGFGGRPTCWQFRSQMVKRIERHEDKGLVIIRCIPNGFISELESPLGKIIKFEYGVDGEPLEEIPEIDSGGWELSG